MYREDSSFYPLDTAITTLKTKSKDDLIHLIKELASSNPSILSDPDINKRSELEFNPKEIKDQINDVIYASDLSYDDVFEVADKLGEFREIADSYQGQNQHF